MKLTRNEDHYALNGRYLHDGAIIEAQVETKGEYYPARVSIDDAGNTAIDVLSGPYTGRLADPLRVDFRWPPAPAEDSSDQAAESESTEARSDVVPAWRSFLGLRLPPRVLAAAAGFSGDGQAFLRQCNDPTVLMLYALSVADHQTLPKVVEAIARFANTPRALVDAFASSTEAPLEHQRELVAAMIEIAPAAIEEKRAMGRVAMPFAFRAALPELFTPPPPPKKAPPPPPLSFEELPARRTVEAWRATMEAELVVGQGVRWRFLPRMNQRAEGEATHCIPDAVAQTINEIVSAKARTELKVMFASQSAWTVIRGSIEDDGWHLIGCTVTEADLKAAAKNPKPKFSLLGAA